MMAELAAMHQSRRRAALLTGVAGMALSIALTAPDASALPVQSGPLTGASVQTLTSGSTVTAVTVSQSRAYAEWSTFNIAHGETFQVLGQTGKNWILVNKVTGAAAATISGNVTANGQVWIIDPYGVTVNAGAAIDVGGLLVSSAAWSSTDTANFLANGSKSWSLTGASGPIVMNGTITARGGVVALIGPSVSVGGTVTDVANSQFLAVAAKDISLSFDDNGAYFTLSGLAIQKGAAGGGVQISSTAAITADRIIVAAAGADTAANIVVGGSLTATQARGDGTDIVLLAADGTGPDVSATPRPVLSGGALQIWSAGSVHGALTVQSGATLGADALNTAGTVMAAGAGLVQNGVVTTTGAVSATSSSSDVTLGGGIATGGALTVGAGGVIDLGANLTAGGALALNGPVVLQSDAALTGATVGFSSTVDGGHNLAITGNGVFGGPVGSGIGLSSLSVSGTSAFDGGSVATTGAQTYTGAATLGANTALAGSTVTFGSTLDGAYNLAISGNGVFSGAIGSVTELSSLWVNGTSALDGGVVRTTGAQTYTGAAMLGANTALAGSTVTFGSTLDGAYNLAISGNGAFGGPVGSGTALNSLSVSGTSAFDGGVVRTTGAQTYMGAAMLGANTALAGSTVTFGSTLDGAYNLAISGNDVFSGAIGSVTELSSLWVNGTSALDGGVVRTTGAQTYTGAAMLGANTALAGSTVTFGSTVDGPYNLAISGNGVFGGPVGSGIALSSLSVSGTSAFDGGVVRTTGTQAYTGAATLGANTTLTGSTVSFGSTVDGPYGLTLDTVGTTTFGGAVGGTTALASLAATGINGSTMISGGSVTTTGAQSFAGAVTLGSDVTLTSTGGGAISFGSRLDGPYGLTVDTAGATTFGGAVGGTAALASLTAIGTNGSTTISGGSVTTTGAQSLAGAVTLGRDATLTSIGGGAIAFGSTLDGAHNLTVDTAGTTTFGGVVGGTTALASLAATAANGSTAISGGSITTTGGQSFAGAVTLGKDAVLTSTGGGAISFGSTVDGAYGLTVDTGGTTIFGGAVGGGTKLASLTVNGTTLLDAVVSTTGGQTYAGPATLGADATFSGSLVKFGSTLDGAHALTITGDAEFDAGVGGTKLASLSVSGTTALNGGAVSTTGLQSYSGAVTLGADTTLTGATVSFGSALDGRYALAVIGDGDFSGAVGVAAPLASLSVSGTSALDGGSVTTTGAQTYTGAATLGADASLTGSDVTFGSTLDGAFGLTLAATGTARFEGAIGGSTALSSLDVRANTIELSDPASTAGPIFLKSVAGLEIGHAISSLAGGVTLETTGGGDLVLAADIAAGSSTVTLSSAGAIGETAGVVSAGRLTGSAATSILLPRGDVASVINLTAKSGLSFTNDKGVTVAGVVGETSVTLTTGAGDLTLSGDVGATTLTLTAAGAISQTGGVVTAGTLTGSAGTTAALNDPNAVTTLSNFTAPGGFSFRNGAGFTAADVSGGPSVRLTADTGDLTLAGDVSGTTTTLTTATGAITQTGGIVAAATLTGHAGTDATLGQANAVGTLSGFTASSGLTFVGASGFTASDVQGGSSVSLTAKSGDLTLAGDVGGTTVGLTAPGAITQTNGVVTATTLTGSAGTTATLNDANAVGLLSSFTAPGGLAFTNAAGFTATGVSGGPSLSLTTNSGDLTIAGDLTGTTVALNAAASIIQTGGVVTATTLTGSAGTSATLNEANAVSGLSDFTAGGGLAFTGAEAFSASGVTGGTSTALTTLAGDLTLSGDVGGGAVALNAAGAIVQTSGVLTVGTLTGSSVGATTLTDANLIGRLGVFTTFGPGADFTLVNAQTLTVTGPLTAGATAAGGPAGVAEGNLSLTTTAGQLNLDGDLIARANTAGTGGTVSLVSARGIASGDPPGIQAQDISISNQSGSVSLGDLTATRDIAVSTTTGSLSIDAASAGGNLVLRAPGDITVVGGLSATGAAAASGAAQVLFASNPTTLAGAAAFNLAGSNVDVKAGGSISVGGATTAATDARFQAGGSVAVADVSAGRDVYLDAAGTVSTGALTAIGRDVAVLAENGGAAIGSASAGDDVAIRAAGAVSVTGGLTAGASGGVDATGVADQLIGASSSAPIAFAGTVYSNLGRGADVDVKAGWTLAGAQSPGQIAGGSISVGGATSAGRDARFQATGAIGLGAVTAGQDVAADGASVAAGALSAANGDMALQASGGVQIASAFAGDAIVISSGGVTSVSGAMTAAGAGTGDSRPRAGDALARAVLGLEPDRITGDVVIAAGDVQLGSISAANGDVLMFARSAAAGGVTYLGGTASSDVQGDFHLDLAEIAGITAHSLNVFAGLTAAGSGDVSIGALNLPQSLPTLRVYTGGTASRVDVFGPVTGAPGSSLIIGDAQLRAELNAPPAAVLTLSQGWTPNVIRVEGTIGGLGAGQAFNQVSLSAQNIYIAPVEPGLDFEAAVKTVRPEALPVYTGAMTHQIAAANLQLSGAGPGVIFERNLARNPSDLSAGVGLSVGKITIATIAPSDAPPSQIALFGVLSPHGVPLNGLSAALSLTFSSQAGSGAPVRFTPAPATIDLYKFSTCAFGGGACFINVPPYNVPPVPVPSQIGDLSDPFAPTDEEPVTSSGGEITWPSVAGGDPRP